MSQRDKFPSDQRDQFMVRLPEGMRDEIAAAAKSNGRSMNSEIIARLSGETETLRDRFAGQALAGLCANPGFNDNDNEEFAAIAYETADAMLAARKGGAE